MKKTIWIVDDPNVPVDPRDWTVPCQWLLQRLEDLRKSRPAWNPVDNLNWMMHTHGIYDRGKCPGGVTNSILQKVCVCHPNVNWWVLLSVADHDNGPDDHRVVYLAPWPLYWHDPH